MLSLLTTGPLGPNESQTGGHRWREHIRELHAYLRRDMRDALAQEKSLYPLNWSKHVLRTVPFVWALARELATAYVQEPGRRWTDKAGKPLADDLQRIIAAEYKRARVNRVMRNAHRQLVALNNATIWVWPDPRSSGCTLQLIAPHEQEVQMGTPFGLSEDDALAWRFRVPLPVASDPLMFTWAIAEITTEREDDEGKVHPARAVWSEAAGKLKGRGLYVQDGANPFLIGGRSMIPVAMLRGSEPGPGEWWSPAPEDLLDAQRAINHDLTDVGTVARLQAFAQPVMKSDNPKDIEQPTGPETAVHVGPTGDYTFAQANPMLDGYVQQNKEYASAVIGMNGLSPATFTKSTGITAVAKQMELIDRESYRREHMEILRAAEQRVYDIMRAEINWMRGGVEVWPEALVEVEYREPVMPVDPLHDAQALALFIALKQTDERKARALRDGVSVEEAALRILEEDAWRKKHGFAVPTAGGTAAPTETPVPSESEETQTDAPEEGDAEDVASAAPVALQVTGADVQKEALNGAQVTALQGIVQAVADGTLPTGTARAVILAAYPIAPADVDAMLDPLAGFVGKTTAPQPFGAPAPVDGAAESTA